MDRHTTVFTYDTDRLLSPIATDAPTGPSLRYEGTYDLVASLRREDDPQMDQGVWKAELKKADWPRVAQTCVSAIESKSKDLQLAAWLLEAWTHVYGFAGMREGLHLVAELCDTYWDGLHPQIQEGDVEFRLAPLFWADEKLAIAAKLIPLTAPQADGVPAYTFSEWENACRQPRAKTENGATPQKFQQSAMLTPGEWLAHVSDGVTGAVAAADELHNVLGLHCGPHAPSLIRLRETLSAIQSVVTTSMRGRGDVSSGATETVDDHAEIAVVAPSLPARDDGPIRTRVDAYRRLAEAAEFLARTEPHSPVPYLVRRAISWGGLGLEELLPELVRDAHQLTEIFRTLQLGEKPRS